MHAPGMRRRRVTAEPTSVGHLSEPAQRINVTILASQYEELTQRGLNVSALLRELIADYLSPSSVNIQVDPETRELFDTVMQRTGATDEELALELREALKRLLNRQVEALASLQRKLQKG
jgi:hypothetical protein